MENTLHDCDICGRPSELIDGLCIGCHNTHPASEQHAINDGEHSANDTYPALVKAEDGPLLFGEHYHQCVAVNVHFESVPCAVFPAVIKRSPAPEIASARCTVTAHSRRHNDDGRTPDRRRATQRAVA